MVKVWVDGEGLREKYRALYNDDNKLGRQSMEQIENLKLYNFANEFVNLYLEKGPDVAAQLALDKLGEDELSEAKTYIALAFEKNGYVIN